MRVMLRVQLLWVVFDVAYCISSECDVTIYSTSNDTNICEEFSTTCLKFVVEFKIKSYCLCNCQIFRLFL